MAEVMNRAARRAAKAERPKAQATSAVETGIYVIPMPYTEAYYFSNIAREGFWNEDPPVIVHRPVKELFRADDAWFEDTFRQMQEVRKPGTHRCVFPPEGDRTQPLDIDIGLIDVQIYFPDYSGPPGGCPMFDENWHEADRLCGGQLHTQMVMATAVHYYRPNGTYALHYHNLIFGLRKQIEPDEHIGVIDLLPLVKALGDGRTIHILEDDGKPYPSR